MDIRMTYDNTFIEVDVIDQGFVTRDGIQKYIDPAKIIYRDDTAYITLRTALEIALVTEFDFQKVK